MAEKIYLVTGKELAAHTSEKQEEILSLFERVVEAYPDATIEQVIASVRDWVTTETAENIEWDYKTGKAAILEIPSLEETKEEPVTVEEPTENPTEEYQNFDLEVPVGEDDSEEVDYTEVEFLNGSELETYDVYEDEEETEPVYEEPVLEEAGTEETVEEAVYEEPVLEEVGTEETVEEPVYEEPVLEEEAAEESLEEQYQDKDADLDEEEDEDAEETDGAYDEDQLFANQNPTVISRQRRYRGLLAEAAKLDRN